MIGVNTALSVLQTHNGAIRDRTKHCGGAVVSANTHAHTGYSVLLQGKAWSMHTKYDLIRLAQVDLTQSHHGNQER